MSDPIEQAVQQEVTEQVADVIEAAAEETAAEVKAEVLEEVAEAVKETIDLQATVSALNSTMQSIQETLFRIENKVFEVKDIAQATLELEVVEAIKEAGEEENENESESGEAVETIEVTTDSPIEAEVFETVKADEPSVKRGAKVRMV